jgi:tRNA(Ile)-lysidine synthase
MSNNSQHALSLLEQCPVWDGLDGGTLLVACSGGRDSTALARATAELLGRAEFCARFQTPPRLVLWHLDHGLRLESPEDSAFVQMLGFQLNVPVVLEQAHLGQRLHEHGGNMEALGRQERYSRLRALINGTSEVAKLSAPVRAMTAHHLADHAETVLHHLIRGTHLAGLAGIAPADDQGLYRPWLSLRPEALEDYLISLGQEYREDASNIDLARTRNRLRHEVMPALLALNPNAREHIARLASTARSAQAWVEERLAEVRLTHYSKPMLLRWLPLADWPEGQLDAYYAPEAWEDPGLLAAYSGRLFSARCGALTSEEHLQIAEWCDGQGAVLKLRGLQAACLEQRVLLVWNEPEQQRLVHVLPLQPNKLLRISGLDVLLGEAQAEAWQAQQRRARQHWESFGEFAPAFAGLCEHNPPELSWHCYLPASIELPLSLRCWREGDRLELPGGGSKTLGDVFTDAKVPRVLRPNWCLLVDASDRPLWLPGLANGAPMQLEAGRLPAYSLVLRSGDA